MFHYKEPDLNFGERFLLKRTMQFQEFKEVYSSCVVKS